MECRNHDTLSDAEEIARLKKKIANVPRYVAMQEEKGRCYAVEERRVSRFRRSSRMNEIGVSKM
jgi:hypothetical protein